MDVYMTDEEQLQALKNWLKKNGIPILIGIVIAFGGSWGWRYWSRHQAVTAANASMTYEEMLSQMVTKKEGEFQQTANYLISDYSGTPYAAFAALFEARQAVEDNKLGLAEQKLSWVVDHAGNKTIRQIARLRAARLLLAQQSPQKALEMVQRVDDKGYLTAINEVKGDALVALGKRQEARDAYQDALNEAKAEGMVRPLLQMKFNQLAVVK